MTGMSSTEFQLLSLSADGLLLHFLKLAPILMGFLVSIVLPAVLRKVTVDNAVKLQIIKRSDTRGESAVIQLTKWRDFVASISMGVLVFFITLAQEMDEPSDFKHIVSLTLGASLVVLVLLGILIVQKFNLLEPRRPKFWLPYLILVIPWYTVSVGLLYLGP
jgi:hypothetical protein